MEREVFLTGIGGQGVQLAAKMLAYAGMLEGRHVMQLSMFGGTMRGGSSECTVVVADAPVEAPPVVPRGWAAVAMHPTQLGAIERKLRPGGTVVWNRTLLEAPTVRDDCRWVPVDAGRIAAELDYLQGQSLVALGAFAALTGIVALDTLGRALAELLPAYRRDSIPRNVACLERGAAAVGEVAGGAPAWSA
jgi:Pyruvate/2-oxoacid:ferredoxin oxidoreductase gamma subunit